MLSLQVKAPIPPQKVQRALQLHCASMQGSLVGTHVRSMGRAPACSPFAWHISGVAPLPVVAEADGEQSVVFQGAVGRAREDLDAALQKTRLTCEEPVGFA